MWFLLLILLDPQSVATSVTVINEYPDKQACYESGISVEADWRQAYPGDEQYQFRCVYMPSMKQPPASSRKSA